MVYDLSPSDVLTVDKKAMTVSSYAVWKITDPLRFMQNIGFENEALRRIDMSVYTSVKNLISTMEQTDVISARGLELNQSITANVRDQMEAYGIEIVDIQIKQFDLPQDNKEAVYTRMISERSQIAAEYTAEGKEEADKIRNSADKDAALLISEARAKSEQLRGEGESAYMSILAEAYKTPERAEFYEFVRSLEALKVSLAGDTTLILPIDSPLTKWLITE
jgi:membrane protease subunit HflC